MAYRVAELSNPSSASSTRSSSISSIDDLHFSRIGDLPDVPRKRTPLDSALTDAKDTNSRERQLSLEILDGTISVRYDDCPTARLPPKRSQTMPYPSLGLLSSYESPQLAPSAEAVPERSRPSPRRSKTCNARLDAQSPSVRLPTLSNSLLRSNPLLGVKALDLELKWSRFRRSSSCSELHVDHRVSSTRSTLQS